MKGYIRKEDAINIAKDLIINLKGYGMYNQAIINYEAELWNLSEVDVIEYQQDKEEID